MELVSWGLTTLITAFVGSFLAAYLKKKGENLATHEDIEKLVEQVSAVTTATKQIEAQISDVVWNRQKRWELTKDTLIRLIGSLNEIMETLSAQHSIVKASAEFPPAVVQNHQSKALDKWTEASAKFSEAVLLVDLVCGKDVRTVVSGFNLHLRTVFSAVLKGDTEMFDKSLQRTVAYQNLLMDAIRREFGIEGLLTPQSSGSSAAQGPAGPDRG